MNNDPVIVIGAGHASGLFAEALRKEGYDGPLCLVGEEKHLPYQRPPLSKDFLSGKMAVERLPLRSESFYEKKNITLKLGQRVGSVDPAAKHITLETGERLSYGTLVFATGTRPRLLETAGTHSKKLFYVRTIDDVERLKKQFDEAQSITIIGAGFIGLEVAAVAASATKKVTVIERENRFMPRVVAPILSDFYKEYHAAKGVQALFDASVIDIVENSNGSITVMLGNGDAVTSDIVVVGIGVIPNSEVAQEAGLQIFNGIAVDAHCRTSDPHIFAIGECSLFTHRVYGPLRLESVQNAQDQARVAAANIVGNSITYDVVPWFWSNQYDLKLQMAGISTGYDDILVRGDMEAAKFSIVYFKQGKMIAMDSVNAVADHMAARKLLQMGITPTKQQLLDTTIRLKDFF